MGQTFARQDVQLASTLDSIVGFVDNTAPAATMESGAAHIADDLNNVRSMLSYHNDLQTGNWYDPFTAPTALETGTIRGIQAVGDGLHLVEKKRVLRRVKLLVDISVPATQNRVVLGVGEIPTQTTAAVGAVTTLGTVVAQATAFDTNDQLDLVVGGHALAPLNLCEITNAAGDPILSSGRRIWGLLHSESGVDGHTITVGGTEEVMISFVRPNAAFSALESCPFADIENQTIRYCYPERVRLEDLNEYDFLNNAAIDVGAGAVSVTRQEGYTNQGATVVTTVANAILDVGTGLTWELGDVLSAPLFQVIEGSGGGTSQVNVNADVDEFDIDAVVVNSNAGISMNTGGTRPINVGVADGVIESTAGDLRVNATGEMFLDDGNQPVSWAQTSGIKLSEDATEWADWETNFGGEVSLLNGINQAFANQVRSRVQAVVTNGNQSANTDINGPGTPHNNTDVDLLPYDAVPNDFVTDVEVYLNGELLRNGANAAANEDVYPGGTPADGDLAFEFQLKGTGSKPDQLTVIVNGQ